MVGLTGHRGGRKFLSTVLTIIIFALFGTESGASTLELGIRDEAGATRQLSEELRDGDLLLFGYFRCAHLCHFTVKNLAKRLASFTHPPQVKFLSLDAEETSADARFLRKQLRGSLGKNWRLFTADPEELRKLTGELGFSWRRDPVSGEITHESAVYLARAGAIARKIPWLDLKEKDLDLSSPQGKFFDFKQFCSAFDPRRSRYGVVVVNSVSALSVFFLLGLGGFYWNLRRKK